MHIGEVRLQVKRGLDGGVAQSASGGSRVARDIKEVMGITGSAVRQSESRVDLNRLVEEFDRISKRLPWTSKMPIEIRFDDQRFSFQIKVVSR
jgi:hypothetical protein